jgi:hypothetical protein
VLTTRIDHTWATIRARDGVDCCAAVLSEIVEELVPAGVRVVVRRKPSWGSVRAGTAAG